MVASYGENLPAMDTILDSYLTQAELIDKLVMTAFSFDKTQEEKVRPTHQASQRAIDSRFSTIGAFGQKTASADP